MAIEQVIQLSAVGGDASAGEIAKTSAALGSVVNVSKGMEEQFSHRFSHIGLQLFSTDLLRSSGLGTEARAIIGTLQTAIFAAGSAFGAAAGPILLVASALAAVIGIYEKVNNRIGESIAALEKQVGANNQSIASYDKTINSLENYGKAIGGLPPLYEQWLDAEKKLRQEGIEKQKEAILQEIQAIQLQLQYEGQHQVSLQKTIDMQKQAFSTSMDLMKALVGRGTLIKDLVEWITKSNEKTKEQIEAEDKLKAKLAELRVEFDRLSHGITESIDEETKAAQESAKTQAEAYNKMWAKRIADARTINKQMEEEEKRSATKIAGDIGSAFGTATAKMIVEGKDFGETMKQEFQNMTERIIEDIIRMEIEWAVLSSLGFPAGGGFGGAVFGGGFASGGSAVVDKPTLFMAGEAGPEIAQFTPMGQANPGQGGGGAPVVNISLNVDKLDGANPGDTLDRLSEAIRRETVSGRKFAATVSGVAGRYPNAAY